MPPLPNVPNTLKVEVQGTANDSRPWANVLHFVYSGGPPSVADCNSIASTVFGAWQAHILPLQGTWVTLTQVNVTDLTSPTSSVGEFSGSSAGTSSAAQIPGNSALLISKPISVRYRGGHPRSYLLAGGEANLNDDGDWNSAFVTAGNTGYHALINAILGGGPYGSTGLTTECAVSYVDKNLNPTPPYRRTDPVTYAIPVGSTVAQAKIATQRRRIRKVSRRA